MKASSTIATSTGVGDLTSKAKQATMNFGNSLDLKKPQPPANQQISNETRFNSLQLFRAFFAGLKHRFSAPRGSTGIANDETE